MNEGGRDSDERAREAVAHVQRASIELIDAARALLDVAEEAVREPGGVMAIVAETLAGLAGAVGAVVPARPASTDAPTGPVGGAAAEGSVPPRAGVEHIRIS